MAEVTGMTAARAIAMEAATIIDGHIDEDGHLILERHDGDEIDAGYALVAAPDASTTTRGTVELATQAETEARSDSTRAITPAGLDSTIDTINATTASLDGRADTLESDVTSIAGAITALDGRIDTLEGAPALTLGINVYDDTETVDSYPVGISTMVVTTGWSLGGGTVVTIKTISGSDRHVQWFHFYNTNETWKRYYYGGWGAWSKLAMATYPASMGFLGEVKLWPTASIPTGFLECNGQAVSRSTYSALFGLIGTAYGVGNGSTTFNVPTMTPVSSVKYIIKT